METRSRRLVGLDLARGVAALVVLIYHADFAFGLRGALLPGAYMSVDLFFIISGLVIARTYEADFVSGRISVLQFVRRRLARLYPLYLATMLVGIGVMTARFRSNFGFVDTVPLVVSALANVFCLPTPLPPYGDAFQSAYPFNGASWSMSYELLINLIYCTVGFRLPTRGLILAWFGLLLSMIVIALRYGGVDVGWDQPNLVAGIPRVCFSFTTGVLIWRFLKVRKAPRSPMVLGVLLLIELLLLQSWLLVPAALRPWMDVFLIAVFLPGIVIAAAGSELRGAAGALSRFLGDVSYSVYLAQGSLIILAAGLTQAVLRAKIVDLAPVAGMLVVLACLTLSYVVFRVFEMPAREWLLSIRLAPRLARRAGADIETPAA